MVISNRNLFNKRKRFEGFCNTHNFEKEIMFNYEYMIRNIAEENFSYKQPVVYAVIRDSVSWKFLCYKRWVWMLEERLHWKFTIWIWSHTEKEALVSPNPLRTTLWNIIKEKLGVNISDEQVSLLWYINSDKDKVSEVHFWVLYLVSLSKDDIVFLDKKIKWDFKSLEELISENENTPLMFEEWSKIALEELKKLP